MRLLQNATPTKKRIINKSIMKAITISLAFVYCAETWSDTRVYFAGLSYIGNASSMVSASPFGASIINDPLELARYNKVLKSAVDNRETKGISFSSELGYSNSGNALSIALAITEEQFQVEETGSGYYAVKATTFAQIVLFDFTDKRIISTVPVITSYTDSPSEISEDYRSKIYQTIYFDQSKKINLVNAFVARLGDVNFEKPFNNWNIKVRNVTSTALTDKYLTKYNVDKDVFKTRVATQFTSAMSKRLGIPILPYTKGQAIGGSMAMRFANTDAVQLTLPPSDYYIDLKVLGFNKKIMKETALVTYPSFIAGLRISIGDVGFDELLFSEKVQSGRILKIAKDLEINEWNEFNNSLSVLSDEFSKQVAKPEKAWFKEKMFTQKTFKKMKKIFTKLEQNVFDNLR